MDSDAILAAGAALANETVTARVATALREGGVRSIALKGPLLVRWLYGDVDARTSADVDLLVAEEQLGVAESVLVEMGFVADVVRISRADRPLQSRAWRSPALSFPVDLHSTLVGLRVKPNTVWRVLSHQTVLVPLAGTEVEVLNSPARALCVALHAAQHGHRAPQPLADLAHALETLSFDLWVAAAAIASQLEATPAFTQGLRLHPFGVSIIAGLELDAAPDVEALIRARDLEPTSLGFHWLHKTPGIAGKTALVARKLFPPPAWMRSHSRLARRGPAGLVLAYLQRVVWLAWQAPRGYRAWRRADAEVRSFGAGGRGERGRK